MSKPKKHHYVPQFLLRNFSDSERKSVFVLDKSNEKIYRSSLLDTGSEKYFYEYTGANLGTDTEAKLAELESVCSPIVEDIIRQECIDAISLRDRTLLCLFASVQKLRTNKQREEFEQLNRFISESFKSKGIDPNKDVENFKELSREEIINASIRNLHSLGADLAQYFINKEIRLVKAPDNEEFYISDHPITLYNHFPRGGRGNLGLGLRGIEIQFPISPKLCLDFFCSETVSRLRLAVAHYKVMKLAGVALPPSLPEREGLLADFDSKTTKILKPENVEFNNSLQVLQSSRFIYSHNGKFDLAIDMLKTNPELRQPRWFNNWGN
jgi:Protein of unknown function (DUF4238)